MVKIWQDICRVSCPEDGLTFDPGSVQAEEIRALDEYAGIRVSLTAELAQARIKLQVDLGFGDAVTPRPVIEEFPTLLDMPAPRLLSYRRETLIAEKFEALVSRGLQNTRMKDFYDLWILASDFAFDGPVLASAVIR